MKLTKATLRYAKTLFDASLEQNVLDAVNNDLKSIQALFDNVDGLKNYFNEPITSKINENNLVSFISASRNPLIVNFILLLKKKKRLTLLCEIQPAFNRFYEKHKSIVRAIVSSPRPLSDSQLTSLQNKLTNAFQAKKLILETKIDKGLIAGFQIRVGDLVADASVKNKILQLKRKLAA